MNFCSYRKNIDILERLSLTFTANGKRQTANIKLLPSVFSSLYGRIKIFLFAVNSKRHFSILYDLFKDNMKRIEKQRKYLPSTVCRKRQA